MHKFLIIYYFICFCYAPLLVCGMEAEQTKTIISYKRKIAQDISYYIAVSFC